MNVSGEKKLRGPAFGDAPTKKIRTLSDDKIKILLDKQLNTKTTLENELKRKRNLTSSIVFADTSSEKSGIRSLDEFQALDEEEKKIIFLREHGLTDHEIRIKLNAKYDEKYALNQLEPAGSVTGHLKIIKEKIRKHEHDLSRPDQFSDSINVNRRELEIDNATYHNTEKAGQFSYLIQLKEKEYHPNDPVCATLCEFEESFKKRKINDIEDEDSGDEGFIGPILCSINERVEIIPEESIFSNRLSLSDIHKIERFKDYKAGEMSNVLYLKNLAKETTEKDLARLFARFYVKGISDVQYKIMNGRMRGQAFITFDDERTASQALLLVNGYIVNSKPIIISYGRGKT